MWNLPGPGIEPRSPALADGFLSTVPPGKSRCSYLNLYVGLIARQSDIWGSGVDKDTHSEQLGKSETRKRGWFHPAGNLPNTATYPSRRSSNGKLGPSGRIKAQTGIGLEGHAEKPGGTRFFGDAPYVPKKMEYRFILSEIVSYYSNMEWQNLGKCCLKPFLSIVILLKGYMRCTEIFKSFWKFPISLK